MAASGPTHREYGTCSVSVTSGAIAFTRTPCRAYSTANERVKPVIAALKAEYTARVGIARNASMVETLMMLPPPRSSIDGIAARVHRNT